MTTLKFKCELLSDVILNQKAATEGPNKTLDFIPGSCFLGIVASEGRYQKFDDKGLAMDIFHSGQVRFGDAHPSTGNVRGLKIPASMFYPKLKKASEELYIHHAVPNLDSEKMKKKQLKQCRNGFYVFSDDEAVEVKIDTNFTIKSAYDREKRCSKDEKMYGYESLQRGLVLYFDLELDNDNLVEDVKNALVGQKRVGRSRTAQYGLVEIMSLPNENDREYKDVESTQSYVALKDKDGKDIKCITVYADGRLVFLDDYGLPTFQPTAVQLGLPENAEILWDKSQIRTFQYAPWNFKRQCFDTDRCGIEKGSVFVVDVSKCEAIPELKSQYVGSYKNEGFGKVIYNPDFLKADNDGKAKCVIKETKKDSSPKEKKPLSGSPLLEYVKDQQNREDKDNNIYKAVNEWVDQNKQLFQGKEKFASQWGAIRGIAMATKDDSKIKDNVVTYISHGVKSTDWDGNRRNKLENFMNGCNKDNIRIGLVNLAAEMAKKCRKEDK